jgi:hypothetical protein
MTAATRIVLEVENSEPLQGRVLTDGDAARPFAGWLGLMDAVRQALGLAHAPEPEMRDDR